MRRMRWKTTRTPGRVPTARARGSQQRRLTPEGEHQDFLGKGKNQRQAGTRRVLIPPLPQPAQGNSDRLGKMEQRGGTPTTSHPSSLGPPRRTQSVDQFSTSARLIHVSSVAPLGTCTRYPTMVLIKEPCLALSKFLRNWPKNWIASLVPNTNLVPPMSWTSSGAMSVSINNAKLSEFLPVPGIQTYIRNSLKAAPLTSNKSAPK